MNIARGNVDTRLREIQFRMSGSNEWVICYQGGATYPIKLQLCNSSGNDLFSSTAVVSATGITQTSTKFSGPVQSPGNANPDSDFRFDSSLGPTGGYIFNLKTTGLTKGSYIMNFTVTGDSFIYPAPFQVQ